MKSRPKRVWINLSTGTNDLMSKLYIFQRKLIMLKMCTNMTTDGTRCKLIFKMPFSGTPVTVHNGLMDDYDPNLYCFHWINVNKCQFKCRDYFG